MSGQAVEELRGAEEKRRDVVPASALERRRIGEGEMCSLAELGTIPPAWREALARTPSQVSALVDRT